MKSQGKNMVYVGSWIDDAVKRGGVHVYEQDGKSGKLIHKKDYAENIAAGYLCFSLDQKYLYVVDERKEDADEGTAGGSIYAFGVNQENGSLQFMNRISTCGVYPNYIAVNGSGSHLIVTNYGSEDYLVSAYMDSDGVYRLKKRYDEASVITISRNTDGSLGTLCDLYIHDDEPSRAFELFQSSPHPHSVNVSPLASLALVADRGCDALVMYALDQRRGRLERLFVLKTPIISGPRNSVFHPTRPYFFVVSELMPFVASYRYDTGTGVVSEICMLSTVPENEVSYDLSDFFALSHPADIRITADGRYLYVTTRGADTISVYAIDESTGKLAFLAGASTEGLQPWTCALSADEKYLYVGNQNSGNISVFKVDSEHGTLLKVSKDTLIHRPVCVQSIMI